MFHFRFLLPILASIFLAVPALAQSTEVDCSIARDPERCEAHQAALAACADQRGRKKTACILDHMPPVDCSKARDPSRCEAAERAKQICAGKYGKALKACLRGEKPSKAKKARKAKSKRAKPVKAKSPPPTSAPKT